MECLSLVNQHHYTPSAQKLAHFETMAFSYLYNMVLLVHYCSLQPIKNHQHRVFLHSKIDYCQTHNNNDCQQTREDNSQNCSLYYMDSYNLLIYFQMYQLRMSIMPSSIIARCYRYSINIWWVYCIITIKSISWFKLKSPYFSTYINEVKTKGGVIQSYILLKKDLLCHTNINNKYTLYIYVTISVYIHTLITKVKQLFNVISKGISSSG